MLTCTHTHTAHKRHHAFRYAGTFIYTKTKLQSIAIATMRIPSSTARGPDHRVLRELYANPKIPIAYPDGSSSKIVSHTESEQRT